LARLIEKQKTTPDIYPLSVNALVTGSNQKSNRDPILAIDDVAVEDTLAHLQTLGLVSRIESGRVEKWRHHIYERWQVSKEEIAVIAELLLRGAQTEGELRTRASRMEPLGDRDALRKVLQPLVERRLAVWLTPEGRRGALLSHGFHDPQELEKLKTRASAGAELEPTPTRPTSESSSRMESLEAALSDLQARVAALEERLSASSPTASPPPNPSA
jgi:uncharacterized protein